MKERARTGVKAGVRKEKMVMVIDRKAWHGITCRTGQDMT